MSTLTLGYSPWSSPTSYHTIYPFDSLFDYHLNLFDQKNLDNVDAVVLWGGQDISPSLYDEPTIAYAGPEEPTSRDLFEWNVMKMALQAGKPIIGVCRGAQIICAFAGGKLVQDTTNHTSQHEVTCYDGRVFSVTSSHHQMMYPYDVEHELLAWSTKHRSIFYRGISADRNSKLMNRDVKEAEVVYFPEINAMAIQPHPEWHPRDDEFNEWVLEQIIEKQFSKMTA